RNDFVRKRLGDGHLWQAGTHERRSDVEDLGVARLYLIALFLDRRGIVLHGLDVLQRLAAGLLLGVRMYRAQAANVHDQLLRFAAHAERLEQFCRVWMRRVLENAVRADDQRRAFGGIDRLDRAAGLLELEDVVLVAVGHHRALTEVELLRWIGGGLHLHD